MITKTRASWKLNRSRTTNVSLWARRAPPRPANTPATTKAISVYTFTLAPNVAATRGFSRTASSARPPLVFISRQSTQTTAARKARHR